MPGLTKCRLAEMVEDTLRAGHAKPVAAGFMGENGDLPWQCEAAISGHIRRIFLFHFWTISHGGRSRAADEYRIQAKLKSGRRLMLRGGIPVLLGYYSEEYDDAGRSLGNDPPIGMEVLAAWDPVQHFRVGSSSSCQVRFGTLYDANLHGAAVTSRRLVDGSVETIAAFRLDRLPRYLRALQAGHQNVTVQGLNGLT